ncbi:MAG TPA: hypothetical protein PLY91_00580 [Methanoregulaceae archaeon]|nr:hypothetical protein [Methanoregulaceae archaeon]
MPSTLLDPPPVSTFSPESVGFNDQPLARLSVPPGFEVNVSARVLGGVRVMVAAHDGSVDAPARQVARSFAFATTTAMAMQHRLSPCLRGTPCPRARARERLSLLRDPNRGLRSPSQGDDILGTPDLVSDAL